MALKNKQVEPNVPRFLEVKARVNDLYNYCGDAIRRKETKRCSTQVFVDMQWIIAEIGRLPETPMDEATARRLKAIGDKVAVICKERRKSIDGGEFVDVSMEVFARYRFLVNELEKRILPLVDDETVELITGEKLADENENRVSISLTDPDDPDDQDDDPDGTDVHTDSGPIGKKKRLVKAG